jgi:hypothetical protein
MNSVGNQHQENANPRKLRMMQMPLDKASRPLPRSSMMVSMFYLVVLARLSRRLLGGVRVRLVRSGDGFDMPDCEAPQLTLAKAVRLRVGEALAF